MFLQVLCLLQLFGLTLASSPSSPSFFRAKPGCDEKCGNISIPYPFGIITPQGFGCSIDGAGIGYQLSCNTSFQPPKLFFLGTSSIEIIDISQTELRIKTILAIKCYNKFGNVTLDESIAWTNISVSRFTFSYTKNVFFGIGCNTYASIDGPDLQGYSSSCSSECKTRESVMDGSCFGQGCCQSTIPKGLKRYEIGILNSKSKNMSAIASFNPCSYGFIAEQNRYTFNASDILEGNNFLSRGKDIPMVLDWAIGNMTCEEAKKDLTSFACQENSYCINSDNNPGYRCTCNNGYAGNPYISPGCQDINECDAQSLCVGICTNTMGSYSCSCPKGSLGDGRKGGSGCFHNNEKFPVLKISLGIALGFFFLIICSSWLYFSIRKRNQILMKAKFFQKNGGLLLKKQLSSHDSSGECSTKIFTAEELKLATKNYDENLILGHGGHGTVFKGTLSDNRTVALRNQK